MKTHMRMHTMSPVGQRLFSRFTVKQSRFALALTGGAIFFAHALLAQGWYTVDDFQYSPGTNAVASGLAKDPTGSLIYSAGYAQDASGVYHAIAFSSGNGGTNWALMDDYIYPASSGSAYHAIAADSAGNIYAAGYDFANVQTWFTRRSADGGATWSTVDAASFGSAWARPYALAADAVGNMYAAGPVRTNETGGLFMWLVRKGTTGSSWATVDQFGTQTNTDAWIAYGVLCHPSAGVFVVGRSAAPPVITKKGVIYTDVWTVRRSQDGGETWVTVDSYDPGGPGYSSTANGVGADSVGNIYAVGTASEASTGNPHVTGWHWIVRKSTDGGDSWVTVDDFEPSHPAAWATAFGSDAHGNAFVAGYDNDGPSSSTQWIVRESVGGSGPWQTVDTFQYTSGKEAQPSAVIGDSLGHIFVTGNGADAAGVQHWLVRKN